MYRDVPVSSASTSKANAGDNCSPRYLDEWTRYYNNGDGEVLLEELKEAGLHGLIHCSRFRSVHWRVFLQCLPRGISDWSQALSLSRTFYDEQKAQLCTDPRSNSENIDLTVNNPLSLEEECSWSQYFSDCDLRGCIRQDVDRTFPELEYFQSKGVRDVMVNVLFVYARLNPHISYKQGMHEILGPVIFVLFFDHQAFDHACELNDFESLLTNLTDSTYLEHDAFTMFVHVMRIIQPWYYSPEPLLLSKQAMEPFSRPQDLIPTTTLVRKLNFVSDFLQNVDPLLHKHLEKLEIATQIFGIRWLRLLFGREFPIQDLLVLWDTIFADGAPFMLVDHIFISMLVFIRELLLQSDYTGCLHYLMHYPPVADVHALLKLALHFRYPLRYERPKYTFAKGNNYSHITVSGRLHPNRALELEEAHIREAKSPVHVTPSHSKKFSGKGLESRLFGKLFQTEFSNAWTMKSPSKVLRPVARNGPTKTTVAGVDTAESLELLKEQISCLQIRLNDVESSCNYVADKLRSSAESLHNHLEHLGVDIEHKSFETVAQLKHLSHVLRGTLRVPMEEAVAFCSHVNSPVEIGRDVCCSSGASMPGPSRQSSTSTSTISSNSPYQPATDSESLEVKNTCEKLTTALGSPLYDTAGLRMENELKDLHRSA